MLTFNELRITPDSKYLIVDVSVDSDSCFDEVTLEGIYIDTQDTFVSSDGPSEKAIAYKIKENNFGGPIYSIPDTNCNPVLEDEEYKECFVESNENMKHKRLIIEAEELGLDLSKTMLFVYAVANNIPDIPCAKDKSIIMGTVVNLLPLYRKCISSLKELNNECTIPKSFINSLLEYKALELSIKTGNYTKAIELWKKLI